jgi:predicted membrane metal-binding protein
MICRILTLGRVTLRPALRSSWFSVAISYSQIVGFAPGGIFISGFTASRSRVLCMLAGLDERLSPQFRRFRGDISNSNPTLIGLNHIEITINL